MGNFVLMRLFLVGLVVLLSGCVLLPVAPTAERPTQAESAPFALNGRVSVSHDGKRHSAGVRWKHLAQSDEILLLTPLGQTAARIFYDASVATLDEGGKHYQADDVEALMDQVLGWHLPLRGLRHWMLGRAVPGTSARITHDSQGRVSQLHQDGWEVSYVNYADSRLDSMPTRLELRRADVQATLLIDKWEWE